MFSRTHRSATVAVSLLIAGSVVLSSCGRKGDLDRPSTPVEQQNNRNTDAGGTPATGKPFLLDPLL